uniref:LAGLIDADG homing endonuclease n=1 Tax=Cyathus jiayuguanensis TaxID=380660 RepID=UPI0023F1E918|nr:LAGLIDADG homing endonuclease [Cyathus jiayuguanensis]WDS46494.1 LAGLIDADG homing endonuclease [Cyathus jiayuguanensis]
MRETLLLGSNSSSYLYKHKHTLKINMEEKSLLTWRQFAWIQNKLNFIHQRLHVEHLKKHFSLNFHKQTLTENNEIFYQWLVGFTDGDGTFSIVNQNNKWSLTYKLSQNTYNLRVLHFIKKQLKVGSIYIETGGKQGHYRIRDLTTLESVIFPIFDKYPLLTTKQFNYMKFKEAYKILSNSSLSKLEKDNLINKIVSSKPTENYISPIWSIVNNEITDFKTASTVMSKPWLVGFTEAEGSFYLVKKSDKRLVHGFEITQKLDKIVLTAIKYLLGIKTTVKITKSGTFSLVTTNSRAIENIIKYLKNTMKGMKSVEYRIWSRSFIKHKGDFEKLEKIRSDVRIMRLKTNTLLNMNYTKEV